ncbi:MAG: hypothetical protein ABRQ25_02140 [Clostridiaceae bacterium]
MVLDGTIINENGITFAVVQVNPENLFNKFEADLTKRNLVKFFPHMHIVLMSENDQCEKIFYGRPDIVKILKSVYPSEVPVSRFTFE